MRKVSVVVPTYRRRKALERCVAAVLTQSLPTTDYELIVVDDAGEPDLAWFLLEFAERFGRFDVRYMRTGPAHGPAAARNLGWRAACAPVVAFTDDDCVPSPDWLEKGLATMAAESADALQGRIMVPLPPEPTDYELNVSHLEEAACATANFFCARAALERVGGFDERFRRAWREDSDLHFTLIESGLRVAAAPRAVVVHPIRPAPWGVGLKLQANSFYDALLYKKHPELYRRVIGGPPWDYYVALVCLALGLAGWAGAPADLRAGAAVWALWTAAFCARRLRRTSKAPLHVLEMAWTSMAIPAIAVYWRLRGAAAFRVLFF